MDQINQEEAGQADHGSLAIEPGAAPSAVEIRAARLVAALGHNVTVRPPRGRRSPVGGTADILIDGVPYDIYCPRTASVARIVSAVASKGDQAQGVVVDLTDTAVAGGILFRVQRTGSRVQAVIVVKS